MSLPEEAMPLLPEQRDHPDDAALVRRSLAGDTAAFACLYEHHAIALATHVRRALPGVHFDAADAVHDAFVRAWCRLPQLRDPERFSPWVRAIALSTARDALRAAGREVAQAATPEAATATDNLDEVLTLRQAVASLPPPQRTAVVLCYLQGLTAGEASRLLGVPTSTVRGRLQKGRAALRAHLSRGAAWDGPTAPAGARRPIQEVLAAIRRRNIDETRDPRGRPIVLFYGFPLDLDLVPSPDDHLHLRGSVWAVGEAALSAVALHADGVDDALAVGPHPGTLFGGTIRNGQSLQPILGDTGEQWAQSRREIENTPGGVAHNLREILGGAALRISVVASRLHGVWAGEADASVRPKLDEVLQHQYLGELGWHGPEIRGAITVQVPAGATFAAVGLGAAGRITLRDVQAHVACVGGRAVVAERHHGDFTMWDTDPERIAGLQGALRLHMNWSTGGNWESGYGGPGGQLAFSVAGLDGSAEIEVGRAAITLEEPRGTLAVENRFGNTVLRLGPDAAVTGDVRSLSGRVSMQIPSGVTLPDLRVTTVFGEIRWSGDLSGWELYEANDSRWMGLFPRGNPDPRLRLHSEAGSVVLERGQ